MPINYGDDQSEWVKLPKVGEEPKEFHIKTAERVDDPNYKYNFMLKEEVKDKNGEVVLDGNGKPVKADVNQGFRYVFTLFDGKKFSISSWKPFYAFKDVNVQEGDMIKVYHPTEGEWKVEKLDNPEQKTTQEVWDN